MKTDDLLNAAISATESIEAAEARRNQPKEYVIATKDEDDDGNLTIVYNLSEGLTTKKYREIIDRNEDAIEEWLETETDFIKLF